MFLNISNKALAIALLLSGAGKISAMQSIVVGNNNANVSIVKGNVTAVASIVVGNNNKNLKIVGGQTVAGTDSMIKDFTDFLNKQNNTEQEERIINLANQSTITVKNAVGNIEVVGHDGSDVRLIISKLGKTPNDLKNISAQVNTSTNALAITTKYHAPVVNACINYQIFVPKNKECKLDLIALSGAISICDINGSVRILNGSGNVKAENILKNIICEMSSGNVAVTKIGGSAQISTVSGTIRAKEIVGNIEADVTSGNIVLQNDTLNKPCRLTTTSGNIYVSARSVDADLKVSQVTGNFHSDFSVIGNQKNGRIGKGGAALKLSVVAGNIVIANANKSKL